MIYTIKSLPPRQRLATVPRWEGSRSSLFNDYLGKLPAAERQAILEAERAYVREHGARLATATHVFRECMTGFEDKPAGSRAPSPVSSGGDWSWQPLRNDLATRQGTFTTFHGVPPSAAELYGRSAYKANA